MGKFLDQIAKRIAAAKGSSEKGMTDTGQRPNPVIINPDVVLRTEQKEIKEQNEPERHFTLFWGRANPPHAGHEQAARVVREVARQTGGTGEMRLTRTHDNKKNPLTPEQKLKHARRAFPNVNVNLADEDAPTILQHLSKLHQQGVTHLHIVAGSDRIPEYEKLLNKYNGVKGEHGYYNFKKIMFHSSGDRDPDAEGTAGVSASSQRQHAQNGNFKGFAAGVPSKMKPKHVKELYDDVRAGLAPKKPKKSVKEAAALSSETETAHKAQQRRKEEQQRKAAADKIEKDRIEKARKEDEHGYKISKPRKYSNINNSVEIDDQNSLEEVRRTSTLSTIQKIKQIPGHNANFAKKPPGDDSKPAAFAANPYESRQIIPFERSASGTEKVEVGYSKKLEPEDRKRQLKRDKAMKLIKVFEAGPWGSGGGGVMPAGPKGGSETIPNPEPQTKNYKLKRKKS